MKTATKLEVLFVCGSSLIFFPQSPVNSWTALLLKAQRGKPLVAVVAATIVVSLLLFFFFFVLLS
jgi:hypothetical protein